MIYQWNQLGSDSDLYGRVKYEAHESWTGRVGARLTKDWKTKNGKKGTAWARVNVWRQFNDSGAKTTFTNRLDQNPTSLRTSLGDTWVQAGVGVSGQLTKNLSAFASVDVNQSLGNNHGHSFSGRVGLRYEF